MDAARLADDDLDQQTANVVAGALGLPESAAQSFTGQHRLRKTANPRAGNFLRKLANVRSSRLLVSTRLYPAELQDNVTGAPTNGSFAIFLRGLHDDDALNLWRRFNVTGTRETLLPLFQRFESHPLLIQALASEVGNYRRAPGNFAVWIKDHPNFDPFSLLLVNVKAHVLEFALRGLDEKSRRVLHTIAAFRMPAQYDTLVALLVDGGRDDSPNRLYANENELVAALSELEDRGLLGWDKRANRYDLHPIVRGVVWGGMGDETRKAVFTSLHAQFDSVPWIDIEKVNSLEDLTPAIELYSTLVGLRRYDDAFRVFQDRIDNASLYRLGTSRERAELLKMLFPNGLDKLPPLYDVDKQGTAMHGLALAYQLGGNPSRAAPLYRLVVELVARDPDLSNSYVNLAETLRLCGELWDSEVALRQAWSYAVVVTVRYTETFAEAAFFFVYGLLLATRGAFDSSAKKLHKSLELFGDHAAAEGAVNACLSQRALWMGDSSNALGLGDRAWQLAHVDHGERDFIRAACLQGAAVLGLGDFSKADERLHHALSRARTINFVEEELPTLITLAELRRRQGDPKAAREFLDDVWEAAERGPYPLFHADAFNVLAQIERDAGNTDKAIEAASKAYRLAWCDGPPYAYHWGLEAAKKHLRELSAPEPDMPPFDESKYEPMPEVEINPKDEFWVDEGQMTNDE